MIKFGARRKWFIFIFTALIIAAFLFVWWMSSSNFEGSYREITQQYYGVVAGQVVSELEASIKYGKSLDSFYNIESVFGKLTSLLPSHVRAAIINSSGEILYTSFDDAGDKESYMEVLKNPHVDAKLRGVTKEQGYTAMSQDRYEIMIMPISDKSDAIIGSFTLIYPAEAISAELKPQHMENLEISVYILIVPVLILIIFLCFVPIPNDAQKSEKEYAENDTNKAKRMRMLIFIVPALVVMLGIGVQSAIMYNQYQAKYKSAVTEGAQGILVYLQNSINNLNNKGIPYKKMYGLSEYLTSKAMNTSIIWNISIYNTIADTEEALKREDTWSISAPLAPEAEGGRMEVKIQISQEYMSRKMLNMLLVFLVTIVVSAVTIFEFIRLPDILIFRRSRQFNTGALVQYEKITGAIRIISFIVFMGMYSSMPFSVILMRQWDARIFGLSTDVSASLPMTLELLAVMLFSVIFARYKAGFKTFIIAAGACIISGNVLCSMATGPMYVILSRVICGAGFAGIKHVLNAIVSSASGDSERTGLNIAGMNAGLLGGIMCGGSLGAVIANSMGIALTYMFTAGILLLFVVLILFIIPWKLLKQNMNSHAEKEEKSSSGMLRMLLNTKVLRYLVMVTLPLNLGLMFIVAFIPGYIQKLGLPVILISYGYLVNGLVGIYFGPILANCLTKKLGRTFGVSLMLIMGGVAILVISIKPSIGIILLSTALMGLFDGFGSPVSMDYFIEMPGIKEKVGVSSSLAFLGVVGNATQMLSPVIYGWLMLMTTVADVNTLLILGLVYIAFALLFSIPAGRRPSKRKISA